MEDCPRCGKTQSPSTYCVRWKKNDCIRMSTVIPSLLELVEKKDEKGIREYEDKARNGEVIRLI